MAPQAQARSTRSKASGLNSPTKPVLKISTPTSKKSTPKLKRKAPTPVSSEDDEEDAKEYDSDALDDDSDSEGDKTSKKRKRSSGQTKTQTKRSPRKKGKKALNSDEDDEGVLDLKEGQEIVGVVVQAPKTGRVPAGQISKNTLDFLLRLKDPECNDREWFKLHEPIYRMVEKEWQDFVEEFTTLLSEVDPQIPHLPPKDVIHRIYRDVRFSNDKTPYKKGISASFSRSGRKGIFAGYHIAVKHGQESIIAAGSWCPGKNELATIRANILRDPTRLRDIISAPEFIRWFGPPEVSAERPRSNIFGMEDELKVAPKGIDKTHKDIDLLKCRSFAVVHRFLDSEVLQPDFKDQLAEVARVMQPLVHCLNDMMTLPPPDEDDAGSEDVRSDDL